MVGTIAPFVEGSSSKSFKFVVRNGAHIFGAVIGGAAFGLALGILGGMALGGVSDVIRLVALLALCLLFALQETGIVNVFHLEWKRQVQESWRWRFTPSLTSLLYGLQLGIGYLTFAPVATLHVVSVGILLTGSPEYGAMIFGLFGLSRSGLTALLFVRSASSEGVTRTAEFLSRTKPLVHFVNASILAVTAGVTGAAIWV